MADNQDYIKDNWHGWREEKSGLIIQYLASALNCKQTPKSKKMISYALHNAVKLFIREWEVEAKQSMSHLIDEVVNKIKQSPESARDVLSEISDNIHKADLKV